MTKTINNIIYDKNNNPIKSNVILDMTDEVIENYNNIKEFKICRCIFNDRYLCLSNGIIYDTIRNKKLIPTINPDTGYEAVWLYLTDNTTKKFIYLHHIIYFSFNNIKELPKGFNIDHINDIRSDNRLNNLQLLTHKENINKSKTNKDTRYKEMDKKTYLKIKKRKQIKNQLIKLNEELKLLNDIIF